MRNSPSHLVRSAAAAALLGAVATAGHAQPKASDVEAGRQLYMEHACFSCHGTVGQGSARSGAPKLSAEVLPFEAFRALVRNPRPAMPRLDPKFVDDAQLQQIHAYMASIPAVPSAKDIGLLRNPVR